MCMAPVTSKLGVFGRVIDPGLATSDLLGKIYKPLGQITNPGKIGELFEGPEPQEPQEAPGPVTEVLTHAEARAQDERLDAQRQKRKTRQASLLGDEVTEDADSPTAFVNQSLKKAQPGFSKPLLGR